jgi:hypothetical protein
MPIKTERNLFGEEVISEESQAELKRRYEQGLLFETELTEDQKRARKLAEQHRMEGGKEMFENKPK